MYWTVHHTPSGYVDRDGWLKAVPQFYNICCASPVNNQILFFYGHDSHFDDRALTQMQREKTSPSYLKWVTPSTNIPVTTGLTKNLRLSISTKHLKVKWMLKYGTSRFQHHHMNSILVKTWEVFTLSTGNIIMDSFSKTHQLSLNPPNIRTNTQACVSSI